MDFIAAVVQDCPVVFDLDSTIDKADASLFSNKLNIEAIIL